jgi:hypothetical protein
VRRGNDFGTHFKQALRNIQLAEPNRGLQGISAMDAGGWQIGATSALGLGSRSTIGRFPDLAVAGRTVREEYGRRSAGNIRMLSSQIDRKKPRSKGNDALILDAALVQCF